MSTVFFETTGEQHLRLVGGVSALERRIREVAKQGVTRVVVAAREVELVRPAPIEVEFVAPGTAAPEGARVERADVVAGIELVDDEATSAAEWKVIRTMNKSFEGVVDALINWRFSMRITRWLSHRSLAVTPNHVTICAIVLGTIGGLLVMNGHYWGLAVGGVLIQVNNILDSVDGELARLRFQYSKIGQWLDNLSDDIVDNLFIAACGVVIGGPWMWLGIGAAAGRVFTSVVTYLDVYARTGTGDVFAFRYWFESDKQTADEVYDPKQISTWLRSLGRRDTFTFFWMIACLANFPYFVVAHGLIISSSTVGLLILHFTVFRKRRIVER
ncbi:MAG: CDP-alcohol phosphatidyltransferase family protein [Deltaproteobacteria bacterium]|nr:CDP-alcohol phosphatidyltransferase family protein [Deltaproteobacteria bacterium]MCW5802272.1 CDP-alcohol phosphatidyltransferase family protein [Deltaproteobacteria bacterium]